MSERGVEKRREEKRREEKERVRASVWHVTDCAMCCVLSTAVPKGSGLISCGCSLAFELQRGWR